MFNLLFKYSWLFQIVLDCSICLGIVWDPPSEADRQFNYYLHCHAEARCLPALKYSIADSCKLYQPLLNSPQLGLVGGAVVAGGTGTGEAAVPGAGTGTICDGALSVPPRLAAVFCLSTALFSRKESASASVTY